jgi:aldehyde:ferredoxin oxidoreductase
MQIYTGVMDSVGCCYFIGPSYENMEIVTKAINAMYGLSLSRDDIIQIGKDVIKTELKFNEKAGITQEMNDVPKFFREEPSIPTGLKYTFTREDLKNIWKILD